MTYDHSLPGETTRPHDRLLVRRSIPGSCVSPLSEGLCLEPEARQHRGTGPHEHHAKGTSESPGAGGSTIVDAHRELLAANDRHAADIRRALMERGVFAVNIMSSPGSGKTSLLEATLTRLPDDVRAAVVEGDIETTADADRLAPHGVPVVQVNTGPFGGDCHLAAPLVAGAIRQLDLGSLDLLLVENVGNLVCPAEFDIGEDRKVVLLSVTEGEDKPLKYPLMFHEASLAVITKTDLLPYLDVDLGSVRANIRRVNPALPVLETSTKTGDGVDAWIRWLCQGVTEKRLQPRDSSDRD